MASPIKDCSGRKQLPLPVASDSVNWSPALIRCGLSCGMPTAFAITSAVRNPMPHTSEASR